MATVTSVKRNIVLLGMGAVIGAVLTTAFFKQRKRQYPAYSTIAIPEKASEKESISSLAVATRVFLKSDSILTNDKVQTMRRKMEAFCRQISAYCDILFIAIDGPHQEELQCIFDPVFDVHLRGQCHIEYVVVSPWNGFTAALNSLIRSASTYKEKIEYLSFQSLEISKSSPKMMRNLIEYLDDNTLVVGPLLVDSQATESKEEEMDVNGSNVPWNTLNIWILDKLQPFGFSLVSDGIVGGIKGGIEEVVTISMIQQLNGRKQNKCKLIDFGKSEENEIIWSTNFGNDRERQKYHDNKMKSKRDRAEIQMRQFAELRPGKVMHIKLSNEE